MKLKIQSTRGFTFLGLVITLTVIGILAVVLKPKVALFVEDVKNMGVTGHLRTVHNIVQSEVQNFPSNSQGAMNLAKKIEERMLEEGKALENPITGQQGIVVQDFIQDADFQRVSSGIGAAQAIHIRTISQDGKWMLEWSDAYYESIQENGKFTGKIAISIFLDEGNGQKLTVVMYAYSTKGSYIGDSKKIVVR